MKPWDRHIWIGCLLSFLDGCGSLHQAPRDQVGFKITSGLDPKLTLSADGSPQKVLSFFAKVTDQKNHEYFVDLEKDPPEPVALARGPIAIKALAVLSNEGSGLCPDSLLYFLAEGLLDTKVSKEKEEKKIIVENLTQSETLQIRIKVTKGDKPVSGASVSLANPLSKTSLSSRCLGLLGSSATNKDGEVNPETPILGSWPLSWVVFDAVSNQNIYFAYSPSKDSLKSKKSLPKKVDNPHFKLKLDLGTQKVVLYE
jgi:hypothetical protein